jgi:predicted nucleic acid-binding protein
MIHSTSVKARVVDIRPASTTLPASIVADANIIYFIHYDSAALVSAGGKPPAPYQLNHYPRWWGRAVSKGVVLCTATNCLAEFAHIVERTELEILWRTDPTSPELDPANPGQDYSTKYAKAVRYLYASQLKMIRSDVETTLLSVRKTVELLPQVGGDRNLFTSAVKEWLPSASDFSDAILVAAAKLAGIPRIVSDDADLISFEGITVYTANRNAIESASAAGKLVP